MLYIVCFHLGAHIAGMITASAISYALLHGVRGTLMTPGLNREDILDAVKTIGKEYDQIVLIGYPPFIKDILVEGTATGIDWKALNTKCLFAAEAFSEKWRTYLHTLLGVDADDVGSINIYGSADFGYMANETQYTIAVRRASEHNQSLRNILDITSHVPALFQYHPGQLYFEEVNGELVVSADAGMPLLRYNMEDRGHIYDPAVFAPCIPSSTHWQLPVISLFGRSNFGVTFYGVNIYPEHIRDVLSSEPCISIVSGKFCIEQIITDAQDQLLELHIELRRTQTPSKMLVDMLHTQVVAYFATHNKEFQKLMSVIGINRDVLKVYVYIHGDPLFVSKKMKQSYVKTET